MTTEAEATAAPEPLAEEEFLPPPDPPVVPSLPTDPPEPLEVDESEKGAQPEDSAVRELNLIPEAPEGTPQGPKPEEPEGDLKDRLTVEEKE